MRGRLNTPRPPLDRGVWHQLWVTGTHCSVQDAAHHARCTGSQSGSERTAERGLGGGGGGVVSDPSSARSPTLRAAGCDWQGSDTCHSGTSRVLGRGNRDALLNLLMRTRHPHRTQLVPEDRLRRGNVDSTDLLMYSIPPYAQRTCLCQRGRRAYRVALLIKILH